MLTDSDSEDEMDQLKHRYSRMRNSKNREGEIDQLKHRYSRMRNSKNPEDEMDQLKPGYSRMRNKKPRGRGGSAQAQVFIHAQ
jgi:hypothetical protein